MGYRLRLWLCFVIILALAWIDYQYFDEGLQAAAVNPQTRRIAHIIILAAITPIGYFGWYTHPQKWIRKMWLIAYVAAIILIVAIGAIQIKTGIFGKSLLDSVMSFRIFFGGPLPFLILYIFSVINKRVSLFQEQDKPVK